MIIDTLKQFENYERMIPELEKILLFLVSCSDQTPSGRYVIDGDNIYANVFEYDTDNPNNLSWESHRAYIDLHVLLSGSECILWAPADTLTSTSNYNDEKDFEVYSGPPLQSIIVDPNQFAVFFPSDGHKVKCHPAALRHVKKVVVKIRII